jgi:hypothetical protein
MESYKKSELMDETDRKMYWAVYNSMKFGKWGMLKFLEPVYRKMSFERFCESHPELIGTDGRKYCNSISMEAKTKIEERNKKFNILA